MGGSFGALSPPSCSSCSSSSDTRLIVTGGSDYGLAAGVGSLAQSDSSWSLESREELAIDSADRLRERVLSLPSPSMLETEQSV